MENRTSAPYLGKSTTRTNAPYSSRSLMGFIATSLSNAGTMLVSDINTKSIRSTGSAIQYNFGAVYRGIYKEKLQKDRYRVFFVLYSDSIHTHTIELTKLAERYGTGLNWLIGSIANIKKTPTLSSSLYDGKSFYYHFLKVQNPAISRVAYRVYKTENLQGIIVSVGLSSVDPSIIENKGLSAYSYINRLNKLLEGGEMVDKNGIPLTPLNVNELSDRVNSAKNSVDINTITLKSSRAPYSAPAPYVQPLPYGIQRMTP